VRATLRAFGLALLLVATLSCHHGSQVLAIVEGRAVTLADVADAVNAQTGKTLPEVSGNLVAALFEDRLEEEVLLAASPERSDRDLPAPRRASRARELVAALCPPPRRPSAAEIDAYLAKHPELHRHGERLLLRQLILPDETTARAAQDRIRRGEDFEKLSRELSRAPNAATGGAIGWIERGQLPPEFEAAVFGLPAGGVSAPVVSSAGWHVFQVVEREPAGDEVDGAIRDAARVQLAAEAAEKARRACLRRLATKVGVEVRCSVAPFPCHNPFEESS
jgi:peptidyl-prolyl cis-trans isomerase C